MSMVCVLSTVVPPQNAAHHLEHRLEMERSIDDREGTVAHIMKKALSFLTRLRAEFLCEDADVVLIEMDRGA